MRGTVCYARLDPGAEEVVPPRCTCTVEHTVRLGSVRLTDFAIDGVLAIAAAETTERSKQPTDCALVPSNHVYVRARSRAT